MFTAHTIKALFAVIAVILFALPFVAVASDVGSIVVVCVVSTIVASFAAYVVHDTSKDSAEMNKRYASR